MSKTAIFGAITLAGLLATGAQAKVSEEEAARLETDLTPMGAERAGNADGSIPAWTGSMKGVPEGLTYGGDGTPLPDPYANEKPLYSITAKNVDQYADKLSVGQLALFKLRPDTFRMDIYPTHRDGAYAQIDIDRAKWNATRTVLANNGEAIQNWTGGTAFPLPQTGIEAMWNTRTGGIPNPTQYGEYREIAVFSNGSKNMIGNTIETNFLFADRGNPVGKTEAEIGTTLFTTMANRTLPAAEKGNMNLVHDPIDYTSEARKAWTYIPGTRRVRQAPSLGFDTPTGPGGLVTVDDSNGFNGAFERYDWKLIGKRELYVPYNNYAFDDSSLSFDELLPVGHPNNDHMRYELHRVWVVEATLKPGERHLYGKRVFYIDEDSWLISAIDSYDNRGEIFRAGMLNVVYHYAIDGYLARTQLFFDLPTGHYLAQRMVNATAQPIVNGEMKGPEYFTPSNLRRQARR
jgi:uncharacterized protein DUF1329